MKYGRGHRRLDPPDGPRESDVGLSAHPGRAAQARPSCWCVDDPQDPQTTPDTAGTAAIHRHIVAALPADAGLDHARCGLLPRRLRAHPQTDLCVLRPRSRPPLRAHPRDNQPSDRSVDHTAGAQPPDGPRRPHRHLPFLVRDRAGQFTSGFDHVLRGAGIATVNILPRCPRANSNIRADRKDRTHRPHPDLR